MTRRVDRGVLFSFLLLLFLGLVVLYAASYYNAQDKGNALSEVTSQMCIRDRSTTATTSAWPPA